MPFFFPEGKRMIDQGIGVAEPNNADMLMGLSVQAIVGLAAPKLLSGLEITNSAGDPVNDVGFGTGYCRDSTNVVTMVASVAMTKRLDASWAAGTGQGGRMSAAALADGTYHCFAIMSDADNSVDFGFDVSPTAPTLPTGYTFFRKLWSVVREAGALVLFDKRGSKFFRRVPSLSYNVTNPGISGVLVPLDVPKGIIVEAMFSNRLSDASVTAATWMLITGPAQTDSVPSSSIFSNGLPNSTGIITSFVEGSRFTDVNGQIRFRLDRSNANIAVRLVTNGWVEQLDA